MQIFCRGTVYAKGAKGDIFMYNKTVWPQTGALCGFEPKKICAVCTKVFAITNFAFD